MPTKKSNKTKPTLLAVFAHPDDEVFLVGGTLATYAHAGFNVQLLCLTHGESGSASELNINQPNQLAHIRRVELQRCCEVLGVQLLPILAFPDGGLTALGLTRLAQPIAEAIKLCRADIVITFGSDGLTGHPDHLAIHHAAKLAFKYAAHSGATLHYASLSDSIVNQLSTRLEGSLGNIPLQLTGVPDSLLTTCVDITQTSHLKWMALDCHYTQKAGFSLLNVADHHILGQCEHFRLAAVAGYNQPKTSFTTELLYINQKFSTVVSSSA